MTISEITINDVAEYLRLDSAEDSILPPVMAAAKKYIMDYTGQTEEELEDHEDYYLAYMILCQDMYDNRAMYTDKASVNKVVDSILFRHRQNFV